MKIIITMAGEGSRFKEVGYDQPKYSLKAKGKTLFHWSLKSLENFFQFDFLFVAMSQPGLKRFIHDECKDLKLKNFQIIELNTVTTGQAETVMAVQNEIDPDDSILIYNIDTFVESKNLHPNQIRGEGWLPSFQAVGDHWSFVAFDDSLQVRQVAEKKRISEFGTIGLYYFSSFKLFREALANCTFEGYKEKFVSPLYQDLIMAGKTIFTSIIPSKDVHVLGTPREVHEFDSSFKHIKTE